MKMGKNGYPIMREITPEVLRLIAEIDELRGRWKAMRTLAPERLTRLKRVATITSDGLGERSRGCSLDR